MGRQSLSVHVLGVILAVTVLIPGLAQADQNFGGWNYSESGERIELAKRLLSHGGVSQLNFHISRNKDEATAQHNLVQTAEGRPAKRSYYGNGPGGAVDLDVRMLKALLILANEGYTFRITELAGGSHSSTSRHYSGLAFDIDTLNGKRIGYGNPSFRDFLKRCRELGATEVFGPGTRGHGSHLHIAWPRGE